MTNATASPARVTQRQAWTLFRLLFGDSARKEAMALEEPWRGVALRLLKADAGDRYALWHRIMDELPRDESVALIEALGGVDGAVPDRPSALAEDLDPSPEPTEDVVVAPGGGPTRREDEDEDEVEVEVEDHSPVEPGGPAHDAGTGVRTMNGPYYEGGAGSEGGRGLGGWPEPIGGAALEGFAGQVVEQIAPTTEADPAAILIQFLVGFGSLVGRGPFMSVDGHDHRANLFAVIVGETSRARKGTSWRRVRQVLRGADPSWGADRLLGGLSSGEGLIWGVRDPIWGLDKKGEEVLLDMGVDDKRMLVVESEFGGVVRVLGREGSTLSAVLRQAYDGDDLRFMTKNNPAAATAPHVSLCGHVTREELSRHLSSVEAFNGLGNRVLWTCSRRSQALPFGGTTVRGVVEGLAAYLAMMAEKAGEAGPMSWAASGARAWEFAYDDLTQSRPGLLGAVTSRAEAHSLRLAMIYALLAGSREIAEDHVLAALAVWRYCDDSAAHLFGELTTDARANAVLEALSRAPDGLSRQEIHRDVFKGNARSRDVSQALDPLIAAGAVRCETVETGAPGRPALRYFAVPAREPGLRRN